MHGVSGGIYRLNPRTGFTSRIVDYSTSPFIANDLVVGPGGDIFVSGVDGNKGDGEILSYDTSGAGGGVYLDLGAGANPGYMAFSPVPEPSTMALLCLRSCSGRWASFCLRLILAAMADSLSLLCLAL